MSKAFLFKVYQNTVIHTKSKKNVRCFNLFRHDKLRTSANF